MKKLRRLPTYKVGNIHFFVDVDKLELRQTDNPANTISFLEMEDWGTHYRLFYDNISKGYSPATHPFVTEVEVPPLVELDLAGMSLKYGISEDQIKGKTDFEVMVDQELLAMRRQGHLPKISVCGEGFFIDVRLHQLRHAEDFFPQINLKALDLSENGETYCGFYHPLIRQTVAIDPELTELPGGVVMIEIPNELQLDPVGAARLYGLDEKDILRRYPLKKLTEAKVIPLSATGLPSLAESNRQLQQQQRQQKTRVRPRY
jgi:hypothetical protein